MSYRLLSYSLFLSLGLVNQAFALPQGFVYLHQAVPSIEQDMRYASAFNFMGSPVPGYQAPECIVTAPTAQALDKVQQQLMRQGLSLKVYDCYRPKQAVTSFYQWSQEPGMSQMKPVFYPNVPKNQLFNQGYIANYSGHSRGSTVDLTIVPLHTTIPVHPVLATKETSCYTPAGQAVVDNSLDMGTGFDCLDPSAHVFYDKLSSAQKQNRMLLRQAMLKAGFVPYAPEWWHFTLNNEPYPNQYFNFPVSSDTPK